MGVAAADEAREWGVGALAWQVQWKRRGVGYSLMAPMKSKGEGCRVGPVKPEFCRLGRSSGPVGWKL